ncbi:MAG: HAD family hydrolase [Treponema sp.]|jgi:putative hydrolase of the HAD superfamily|nr:HAD family hydrolase [Treponema sp.]
MKEPCKKTKFSAVAFDLDGTLYPNSRFYVKMLPFVFKEFRFLKAFGKARDRLRLEALNLPPTEAGIRDAASFYRVQAQYMGEILSTEADYLLERTENLIYRGWEPLFENVKLFPHVKETLSALRKTGIKLGMLSDFPPEKKIEYFGLSGFWDAVHCSESSGRLKPDPLPFLKLAEALGLPPQEVLYAGNNFAYDVLGAQKAGMKAAWIRTGGFRFFKRKKERLADFVFNDYRQLRDFVLA